MKSRRHVHLLGGILLAAGLSILLSGCMGFGGDSSDSDTTSTVRQSKSTTTLAVADINDQPIIVSPADRYSNFQSKDPFTQQQVPTTEDDPTPVTTLPTPTTTTTTTTTSTSSTTTSSTTTTSTSSPTTTTSTSSPTTSTTSFYTHMLQILRVGDVDGTPAVTFQVDNNVYVDQHVGDKVSTSWGDVTVAGINTAVGQVTLLHGGRTLTMAERQILFE